MPVFTLSLGSGQLYLVNDADRLEIIHIGSFVDDGFVLDGDFKAQTDPVATPLDLALIQPGLPVIIPGSAGMDVEFGLENLEVQLGKALATSNYLVNQMTFHGDHVQFVLDCRPAAAVPVSTLTPQIPAGRQPLPHASVKIGPGQAPSQLAQQSVGTGQTGAQPAPGQTAPVQAPARQLALPATTPAPGGTLQAGFGPIDVDWVVMMAPHIRANPHLKSVVMVPVGSSHPGLPAILIGELDQGNMTIDQAVPYPAGAALSQLPAINQIEDMNQDVYNSLDEVFIQGVFNDDLEQLLGDDVSFMPAIKAMIGGQHFQVWKMLDQAAPQFNTGGGGGSSLMPPDDPVPDVKTAVADMIQHAVKDKTLIDRIAARHPGLAVQIELSMPKEDVRKDEPQAAIWGPTWT